MNDQSDKIQKVLSEEDCKKLLEKYYAGETTLAEERLIDEWLSSDNTQTNAYNPDKAVRSWIAVWKRENIRKEKYIHRKTVYRRIASIAAVIALLFCCSATIYYTRLANSEYYLAYIHSVKITDEELVFQQMQQSINNVSENTSLIDEQLHAVFEGFQIDE